jgi:uncharacterized protein YndB with AHSA1/START domain
MPAANNAVATDSPPELSLTLTRILDAPRELVFRAWTEPEHLMQWSAPHGFTVTHADGELKPGGKWRSCMRSPDGKDLWLGGTYLEIAPPERLVFTHGWDEDGPGRETTVTVTLEDHNGKTRLTLQQSGFPSMAERDGHEGGWSETLERLAAYANALAKG